MEACDNLYGTREQWKQLHAFIAEKEPKFLRYMRPEPDYDEDGDIDDEWRICYIADIQGWLIANCPLDWVQEKLNENCEIQRFICGKAHHED